MRDSLTESLPDLFVKIPHLVLSHTVNPVISLISFIPTFASFISSHLVRPSVNHCFLTSLFSYPFFIIQFCFIKSAFPLLVIVCPFLIHSNTDLFAHSLISPFFLILFKTSFLLSLICRLSLLFHIVSICS